MKLLFFKYIGFVIFILLITKLFSILFLESNVLISAVLASIYSIFIVLSALYFTAIKKIKNLYFFKKKESSLYKVLSGRILIYSFWILYAMFSSWIMLAQVEFFSFYDWATLISSAVVLFFLFNKSQKKFKSELKDFLDTALAVKFSVFVTSVIMLILYVFPVLIKPEIFYSDIKPIIIKSSYLKSLLYSLLYNVNLIKEHFFKETASYGTHLQIFILSIGAFGFFYNMNLLFSLFLIGKKELRRIFNDFEAEDEPKPISFKKAFNIGFFGFIGFLVYLYLILYGENFLKNSPEHVSKIAKVPLLLVEVIDGDYYKDGTVEEIKEKFLKSIPQVVKIQLERDLDKGFDQIEKNVDGFLDWYYSLSGEYSRISAVISEELFKKKIEEYLLKDNPFKELSEDLKNPDNERLKNQLYETFEKIAKNTLEKNKIRKEQLKNIQVVIKKRSSLEEIFQNSYKYPLIKFVEKSRIYDFSGAGGLAGSTAVGTVLGKKVSAKITAKIVEKGLFKAAWKQLVKFIAKKGVSMEIAGAGIGGAIGSVVPGVGTVVGTAVGAVVGFAIGLVIDKASIEIDEYLHREEFKRELIETIEEVKKSLQSIYEKDINV